MILVGRHKASQGVSMSLRSR